MTEPTHWIRDRPRSRDKGEQNQATTLKSAPSEEAAEQRSFAGPPVVESGEKSRSDAVRRDSTESLVGERTVATEVPQHSLLRSAALHLAPGVVILGAYLLLAPWALGHGRPALWALLWAALAGVALQAVHLAWAGRQRNGRWSLEGIVTYRERVSLGGGAMWVVLVTAAGIGSVAVTLPVESWLRQALFGWLPEWYFYSNPRDLSGYSNSLLNQVLWLRLVLDGIIFPVVEEFYFRGYLMPRMERLGRWTPWVHHALFTIYHFWQPYNYLTIYVGILPMVWVAWKKRSLYISLAAHLALNLLGALAAFSALS